MDKNRFHIKKLNRRYTKESQIAKKLKKRKMQRGPVFTIKNIENYDTILNQ
jgi:hypothetical protein